MKLSANDMARSCGLHLARIASSTPFVQRVMNDNGEELYRGTMPMIKKWRETGRVG